MILVVLQNAYREKGEYVDREEWLERLWLSHTGRRLKTMLPEGVDFYIDNATPEIGKTSDSCFPADAQHLKMVIDTVRPEIILACGLVAQAGLEALGYAYVAAPHPAWRQLKRSHCEWIRIQLERMVGDDTTG